MAKVKPKYIVVDTTVADDEPVLGYYEVSTTTKDPDEVEDFASKHYARMMKTIKRVAGKRVKEVHVGEEPSICEERYDTFVTWEIKAPEDILRKLEPLTNFLVDW